MIDKKPTYIEREPHEDYQQNLEHARRFRDQKTFAQGCKLAIEEKDPRSDKKSPKPMCVFLCADTQRGKFAQPIFLHQPRLQFNIELQANYDHIHILVEMYKANKRCAQEADSEENPPVAPTPLFAPQSAYQNIVKSALEGLKIAYLNQRRNITPTRFVSSNLTP